MNVKASGTFEIENSEYKDVIRDYQNQSNIKVTSKFSDRCLTSIKESDNEYSMTKNKSKPSYIVSEIDSDQPFEKRISILELEEQIEK